MSLALAAAASALAMFAILGRIPPIVAAEQIKPNKSAPDPLDFAPDIKEQIRLLRALGESTGNAGNAARIEESARKIAMLAFRRIGRDRSSTSRLDGHRAADDMMLIRAEIVNAVQTLYICTKREKHHAQLDGITERLMRDTMAYVKAARATLKRGNVYEGGRGFPSPWSDDHDPAYDVIVYNGSHLK
jgi:hypothetical protein